MPETMATLVEATLAKTTSRTATVPTATRRTHIASTTAKECTRHWVHIWKHPLRLAKGLVQVRDQGQLHEDQGKRRPQCTPQGPIYLKPEENLEAGQEGHHKLQGKPGVSECLYVIPPTEPTLVPHCHSPVSRASMTVWYGFRLFRLPNL